MARAYRNVRPKANRVYAVGDVMRLYCICRNTLTNWIKAGLRPVDQNQPQLFRGAELIWFHEERALDSKQELRTGQFKCFSCKARIFPDVETVSLEASIHRNYRGRAKCPECNWSLLKLLSETACDKLITCLESNTSLQSIDEYEVSATVGIGTVGAFLPPSWNPENERILFEYQLNAKRFDPSTVDAMFASIRHFEKFNAGKPFSLLKTTLVSSYRDKLCEPEAENGVKALSRSTVAHRASHIKGFLKWLVQQEGYRKLNGSLCDYVILSKSQSAKALQPPPKDIPSENEVLQILAAMPQNSLTQRRDRAIVAASFLFGTRADNTASLRIGDIDCVARKVLVDATKVRVKNSKSQTICWFPVGESFEQIIGGWINELLEMGAVPVDALFPPDAALTARNRLLKAWDRPIAPWGTDHAVRRAFANGCEAARVRYYTPHSVRHFLVLLQDKHCKTGEERKAWSFNLGHENEQVTLTNYAKMTNNRRDDVFRKLSSKEKQLDDDKDLLLALYEHRLTPGTLEFERATMLQLHRLQRQQSPK